VSIAPQDQRLLPDLTMNHASGAVRALLELGCPVDTRGSHGATALHWACWKGYPDLVELLLDRGAPLTTEDRQFHATPAGWFTHGVQNCDERGGDYPAVARLLLDAGATLPAAGLPTGDAAVDAVLRERGVIT
jgi:ankyrin repeat protein